MDHTHLAILLLVVFIVDIELVLERICAANATWPIGCAYVTHRLEASGALLAKDENVICLVNVCLYALRT